MCNAFWVTDSVLGQLSLTICTHYINIWVRQLSHLKQVQNRNGTSIKQNQESVLCATLSDFPTLAWIDDPVCRCYPSKSSTVMFTSQKLQQVVLMLNIIIGKHSLSDETEA